MTPDEKQAYARSFPVHVGVDTAKQFHVLVAQGPDGRRSKLRGFCDAPICLGALGPVQEAHNRASGR